MVHFPRKRYEYEKARLLRSRGLSYREIENELNIAKSSISLWCRDVVLSEKQKQRLITNSKKIVFYKLGALANKNKRDQEIIKIKSMAKQEISELSVETFRVAGTMLYWAEGTKTQSTAVSNSDPRIIRFMVNWLQCIFNISPEHLTAHLHIHYGDDDSKIKKYWSKLTGIPLKNFGKSFIKPKGTGHRTNILPNGIIKIRVKGVGTENLRHRILAWSEKIYTLSDKFNRP